MLIGYPQVLGLVIDSILPKVKILGYFQSSLRDVRQGYRAKGSEAVLPLAGGSHPRGPGSGERSVLRKSSTHCGGFSHSYGYVELPPTTREHRVLGDKPVALQESGFGLVDTISIRTA